MPNYANGDIVLFTLRYQQQSQILLNTCHFYYQDNIAGLDDVKTFNDAMLLKWDSVGDVFSTISGLMANTVQMVEARLQVIWPNRYVPQILALNRMGAVAGAEAPINTAMVVTKKSIFATRWGQGSWHQPGLPASAMNNSAKWIAQSVTNLVDGLEPFMTTAQRPASGNGQLNGTMWQSATPGRTASIVKLVGQDTIRTQRTRTYGVGT